MIRRLREWVLSLTGMVVALIVLSSFLIASYELDTWPWADRRPLRERYEFATVRRTTLLPIQSAPGRVESTRRTVIQCELENIAGSGSTGGGASTLLWMLPEGTPVRRGDLLAKLDGSTYEEMFRQQVIVVEQAKASHLQARLDYEIAQLAVREYLEGTVKETVEGMEGSIALARADVARAEHRLEWTKKMNQKGYASAVQVVNDRHTVNTLELALKRQLGNYDLFRRFTLPKTEKTLRAAVTTAETRMNNEYVRLQRQLERYELLRKQVERCTIRAPHDGIFYYCKGGEGGGGRGGGGGGRGGGGGGGGGGPRSVQIEEGMPVRQRQALFYLPDLTEMEIQVALNQSVVDRIRPGLRVRARFEALPQLELPGEVVSVNQIPVQQGANGEDVRYFQGIVALDQPGQGLKPGMSARVEIILPPRPDVLAVPHRAIVAEQGRNVAWVLRDEQLLRREVRLGQATPELVEIREGLAEGEQVALDPPTQSGRPQSLSGFLEQEWVVPASPTPTPAAAGSRARRNDQPTSDSSERRKNRRKSSDGQDRPRGRTRSQGEAA